jgi:hypothetical protein
MISTQEFMMTNSYIGIDPGAHGAIVAIDSDNNVLKIRDLSKDYIDYWIIMNDWEDWEGQWDRTDVAVEDVCGRPGQSCQANTTFMKLAGMAELTAYSLDSGMTLVKPQVWKKHFGLITKGLTKTERKHLSIDLAKKLFPAVADQLTASKDGRAEALLIARYMKDVQCQQELCRDSSKTDSD